MTPWLRDAWIAACGAAASSVAVAALGTAAGCRSDGISSAAERRELEVLESALGALADAPAEDRLIRLEQLDGVKLRSPRLVELKSLCASSYHSFERASALLAEARAKTGAIETELASFRTRKEAGESIPEDEAARLSEKSRATAAALRSVSTELDQAERLVADCDKRRLEIRAQLLHD